MPEGWREVRLRDVLALDLEPVIVRPEKEYRLAGVYSFGRGLFRRDLLLGANTSYKQLHRLRKGQLVLSKLKAWEGAITVVGEAFDGYVLSPEFPTFSVRSELDPAYLSLVCSQHDFWEQLQLESRGVGGRRERVHPRRLLEVPIVLPPLAEQRRIVDLIGAFNLQHAALASAAESTEALNLAILKDRVGHLLSASGVEPLGALASTRLGKMLSKAAKLGGDEWPYVRNADVQWDRINLSDLNEMGFSARERDELTLRAHDVLICEGGEVGRCAVVDRDLPGVYFQKAIHRVRCGPRLHPRFLMYFMRYSALTGGLANYSTQLTIQHLTGEKLRTLPIPTPPLDVQRALVSDLDVVVAARCSYDEAGHRVRALRSAVLSELMPGDHEIPDSYDVLLEAAS